MLLCFLLVGSIACNPLGGSESEVTERQVEVVRGDLTVTVSGSGNVEVADEAKLAFGVAGRIDEILVQEGDKVRKGDVLARLDTEMLELAITQAEFSLTQAQVGVIQAEVAVTQAEVARTNAQVALEAAEENLETTQDLYAQPEIHAARAALSEAESYLEYAKLQLSQASIAKDIKVWTNEVAYAEERLRAARLTVNKMLAGPDTREVAIAKLQVTSANQSLQLSEQSLALAEQSLTMNEQSLKLAERSLAQARKQLDEAVIIAPFDGLVASILASDGDIIPSPSVGAMVIIYLIDPTSIELVVQVDEIDVIEVKAGQKAIIEIDALPTTTFQGTVSSVSLLPTVQAGVRLYNTTVEFHVPEGSGIRVGMSASTDIIIAERSNVLLVPDRAVKLDSQGSTIVEVMVGEQIEERAVVIGVSDGFNTEIVTGLREGDVVIEKRSISKQTGSGFF